MFAGVHKQVETRQCLGEIGATEKSEEMSLRKKPFEVRSRRTIADDHNGHAGYVSKHGEISHLLLMGQPAQETYDHFALRSHPLAPRGGAVSRVESFAVNAARPIVQARDPLLFELREGRM
jgi:hypothetical protein